MFDKPGCFGSAITYNVKSKTCKDCPDFDGCGLHVSVRVGELRQMVNVDSLVKAQHTAPKRTAKTLPDNVLRVTATMSKAQQDAVAFMYRLKEPTPVNIVSGLITKFGYEQQEATSLAKSLISILVKENVAKITNGEIIWS